MDFKKKNLIPVEYINTLNQQSKENDVFMMLIAELHPPRPRYIKKLLRLAVGLVSIVKPLPYFSPKVRVPILKEEDRESK